MFNELLHRRSTSTPSGLDLTGALFDSGSSEHLSLTYTTNATVTVSVWVKRGKLGTAQPILEDVLEFNADNTLTAFGTTTTEVFRDPGAWMHLVASSSGLYVNGVSVATPTSSSIVNKRIGYDGTNAFDGYMADFYLIDTIDLTASSFGETDANGHWVPKAYTTATGTNTCHIEDLSDGEDSLNSNDWTVTSGPSSVDDSPTNNFCTLSPLYPEASGVTLSTGNLMVVGSSSNSFIASTITVSSGKYYFEIEADTINGSNSYPIVGISTTTDTQIDYDGASDVWVWCGNSVNNGKISIGTTFQFDMGAITAGDIIGFALDMDNGKLWVSINNTWYNSGNPATDTNPTITGLTGSQYSPAGILNSASESLILECGQRTFSYTPPTGFLALCTSNLDTADAVITSGSFTGNASTDGPFVWCNGTLDDLTINSNAVTWGTHALKLANGFKLITTSSSYNSTGTNTWTSTGGDKFVYSNAQEN